MHLPDSQAGASPSPPSSGIWLKHRRLRPSGRRCPIARPEPHRSSGFFTVPTGRPSDAIISIAAAANVTIAPAIARSVTSHCSEVEAKIEHLVFKDVNAKLAGLLIRLATEYGVDDARGTLVALKITHQEMANLIGSTRETVSLTLSQFKRKGLIQTDGRKVILADREGLRALA